VFGKGRPSVSPKEVKAGSNSLPPEEGEKGKYASARDQACEDVSLWAALEEQGYERSLLISGAQGKKEEAGEPKKHIIWKDRARWPRERGVIVHLAKRETGK